VIVKLHFIHTSSKEWGLGMQTVVQQKLCGLGMLMPHKSFITGFYMSILLLLYLDNLQCNDNSIESWENIAKYL